MTATAGRTARLSSSTFDTFEGEPAREAHVHGQIPAALAAHADLLARDPDIRQIDVLAVK